MDIVECPHLENSSVLPVVPSLQSKNHPFPMISGMEADNDAFLQMIPCMTRYSYLGRLSPYSAPIVMRHT
jgi:hypothetical protein